MDRTTVAIWELDNLLVVQTRKSVTFRETVSKTVPKPHEGDGLGKNEGQYVNQHDELGLR